MAEIYPGLETINKTHDESRQGEVLSDIKVDAKNQTANSYMLKVMVAL